MTTHYLTQTTYALRSDTIPVTHQDYYVIRTEPVCGNLSGDPVVDGWAGTTNDWATYGHGEYATLDAARDALCALLGITIADLHRYELEAVNAYDETIVETYSARRTDVAYWDAGDWLTDPPADLTSTTTDEKIEDMAGDMVEEAEFFNGVIIDHDATVRCLQGMRAAMD